MKPQGETDKTDRLTGDRATELETLVQCRLAGQVRDFQVVVKDQGPVLCGHARSYYAKQLAQHAVMETTDLPILANDIEVVSTGVVDHRSSWPAPESEGRP